MSSFVLKIIACITMFIDHAGYVVYGKFSWFNFIGRLAFPIFAYQITEGYQHTKNLKKYILRLFIFALISQIPFQLFHSIVVPGFALNVFFTLLLGLLSICVFEKFSKKWISIPIIVILCIIAEITNMDYGCWGVLLIFVFYLFRNNKYWLTISFLVLLFIRYLPNIIIYNFYYAYILLFACTFLSIIPIVFYNKKQGRKMKCFLYIFYPAHLLILYLLSVI